MEGAPSTYSSSELSNEVKRLREENEKLWREVAALDHSLHGSVCGVKATPGCYWCTVSERQPLLWSAHEESFKKFERQRNK